MTSTEDIATKRRHLSNLVAAAFSVPVSIGVCEIASADEQKLHDVERHALQNAVPKRRREFAAGRIAARQALRREVAIEAGADRAPIWPVGLVGSISHDEHWAIAAVHEGAKMLGLDLEAREALPGEVWNTVLMPSEFEWCQSQTNPGIAAREIFCIKEACYKAQYPISRKLFGFEMFTVQIFGNDFEAVFQNHAAPFKPGSTLRGRIVRDDTRIISAVLAL